jgi:hypothetical protein
MRGWRWLVAGIVMTLVLNTSSKAQVFVGDSVRLLDGRDLNWTSGRLIAQRSTSFLIGQGHDSLNVAIAELRRLERWERHDRTRVLGWSIAAGVLAGTAAYFLTPVEESTEGSGCVITGLSSVCGTRTVSSRPMNLTTMQVWGGVGGAVGGFVGLSLAPGRWKIVINR